MRWGLGWQVRLQATPVSRLAMVGLALATSAAACGGGSASPPPPSCLQVPPCGGDVVGTWSFLGACSNVAAQSAQLAQSCPGASITAAGISLTGLVTFSADSTYSASNWRETFAASETIPLSCVGASTCAAASTSTTDMMGSATVTVMASCSGATTCNCRISGSLTLGTDSGSWFATGTTLDMQGGATTEAFSYCVENDRLHLLNVSGTTLLSDIVAIRQ